MSNRQRNVGIEFIWVDSSMEVSGNDSFIPQSSSTELTIEQEFIINKTLLTHESNRRVDCKILFQVMENVIFYASNSNSVYIILWFLSSFWQKNIPWSIIITKIYFLHVSGCWCAYSCFYWKFCFKGNFGARHL